MVIVQPGWSLCSWRSRYFCCSSGEFRRVEWSIPPSQASLPVIASAAEAEAGPGPIVRGASGIQAVPLEPKPSLSGIHETPNGV